METECVKNTAISHSDVELASVTSGHSVNVKEHENVNKAVDSSQPIISGVIKNLQEFTGKNLTIL